MFSKRDFLATLERLRNSSRDDIPFSELQDFIEAKVLPALDEAEAYLSSFEDQDCVVVLEIELESGREVYEFETGRSFEELIDDDPDFLGLRPGNHMPAAYDELVEMAQHLDDCASSLAQETDPQNNDIFTSTDDVGWVPMGAGFSDTVAMIAGEIESGLENGVTFNLAEDPGEPEAPDFDILLDLEEMFTDPLDPWTAYFPAMRGWIR